MEVLNYHYHDFSLQMTLETRNIPDFLKEYDIKEEQDQTISICQDLGVEFSSTRTNERDPFALILTKFIMNVLEMIYFETGKKGISGILFILPEHQAALLYGVDGLFSYIQPHRDHQGERMYMYLPTQLGDYDMFVEMTQDLTRRVIEINLDD
ncbi:MAG TPA: hypothetical protein VNJ29_03160 [Candidatus Nitrosotenuis sp.]|jgi:hypothetical protein|nr:hypothetical protein [Candidatus Nitrosotenuis sp.]